MDRTTPPPVVVAVDVAGSADDALDWAAAEAAARHSPLRVVHAFDPPLALDPYGMGAMVGYSIAARSAAAEVLRGAAARASSVAPEIEVTTRLVDGRAEWALGRQAHEAQLLVVGRRRHSGPRRLFAGSVSTGLAVHAGCPVVVLRPLDSPANGPACVVVGVDRGPSCTTAIGFAFQSAWQRRIPLVIVHACKPRHVPQAARNSPRSMLTEVLADAEVERTIARWRSRFPDVRVIIRIVGGDPVTVLIAESSGSAMLVVGSPSRGRRIGRLLGSVGKTVLENARCPVGLVRHDVAMTAGSDDDSARWSEPSAP